MAALVDQAWFATAGFWLTGVLCGCMVRHLWGAQADRAHARRIATLCDRLDEKDSKLHVLRAELQAARQRAGELQGASETRHAGGSPTDRAGLPFEMQSIRVGLEAEDDPALRLEDNEDPAFFRRRVRALESRAMVEPASSRRTA